MVSLETKKSCKNDALFTINQQQDEAALVKFASSSWLLSLSCQSTKMISISFSSFSRKFR